MLLKPLLVALLITPLASMACDADVLRLNYRKNAPVKKVIVPSTTAPDRPVTFRKAAAPAALLIASTKLGPR